MITTDYQMTRQIIFKFNVILKIHEKEPSVSVDTALWVANRLWEKELKDEKKLVN